jgi:hypothetical protein
MINIKYLLKFIIFFYPYIVTHYLYFLYHNKYFIILQTVNNEISNKVVII